MSDESIKNQKNEVLFVMKIHFVIAKCQINDEMKGVKFMKSLNIFISSSQNAIRHKNPIFERGRDGPGTSENENEDEEHDRLTNREKRGDKYMIYIYFLYNQFVILFVIIRHGNEYLRRIKSAYGRVMNALDAVGIYRTLAQINRLISKVLKMSTLLFEPEPHPGAPLLAGRPFLSAFGGTA